MRNKTATQSQIASTVICGPVKQGPRPGARNRDNQAWRLKNTGKKPWRLWFRNEEIQGNPGFAHNAATGF